MSHFGLKIREEHNIISFDAQKMERVLSRRLCKEELSEGKWPHSTEWKNNVLRKNWREFCLGKEDLSEGKRPHSTKWLPNLLRKKWREFRLGKKGLSEAKWPHSTKWVKKMLQKIGESPVHVCIGFVSCNGDTVRRNQKNCEKHEKNPHRKEMTTGGRR